jgi:hypothetical protein
MRIGSFLVLTLVCAVLGMTASKPVAVPLSSVKLVGEHSAGRTEIAAAVKNANGNHGNHGNHGNRSRVVIGRDLASSLHAGDLVATDIR